MDVHQGHISSEVLRQTCSERRIIRSGSTRRTAYHHLLETIAGLAIQHDLAVEALRGRGSW